MSGMEKIARRRYDGKAIADHGRGATNVRV